MNVSGHPFDAILQKIRSESNNPLDLGTKFEKITKNFFKIDPLYTRRFKNVWLWKEWNKRDGPDTGIDLVAEECDGQLCAIQCKCYADDGSIDTKSIGKFLAKANSLKIKHTILVYTGEKITSHALKILKDSGSQIIQSHNFRNSSIDWTDFPRLGRIKDPKKLRSHQSDAVKNVLKGFENHDRGKMIMACGTGKTLTSLHIAEQQVRVGGMVLYVVPSISLILQSMREWSDNANIKHNYLAVCSDKSTGEDGSITELESPVSTDFKTLKSYLQKRPKDAMTVIFSTYHSLNTVKQAVRGDKFDIVFCDEAHRTTGVEDKSFFTTIHKDTNIFSKKRLYMTATPRVYSDAIQAKMGKIIYSMDDEKKFGPNFYNLTFADAVKKEILSDFRVKIAIVPADKVDADFQQSVADKDKSMPLDERTLLAAVWHGLTYPEDNTKTPKLLQRVIAFANRIDRSMMFAGKISDENDIDRSFAKIVEQYEKKNKTGNKVEVDHIDGKTKALERRDKMRWLDESNDDQSTCRIVSNAKCLSEGVDVPALDGVIFLNPRKSRVDVVQSVGRVMRKAKGKKYGYVILPVAIPAGLEYHEALDDNKTFKVVWQVLNALRSHDENFGAEINKLILDKNPENTNPTPRISASILGQEDITDTEIIDKFFTKIKSKLVEKVGDFDYYDKYGQKLGSATHTIEARLKQLVDSDKSIKSEIELFHSNLKQIINDSVTQKTTIQTISQHMVLSRVFDELFAGEFSSHNPISIAFEDVVSKIGLVEELKDLEPFYDDVKKEIANITTREARQNFIKKIYGNFFESADKKGTEQHGVVYTPVEVIDFIINSVQHILKTEFNTEFNNGMVKVLEPFAGTGTFLVRLLESGYITSNMYEKYKHDLYANELILLAYYVAAVNIETTYSSLRKGNKYVPFDGINYTDTLRINARYREGTEYRGRVVPLDGKFKLPHERIQHQRGDHVHVVIGNPPYSVGQSDYNDQNQNIDYPELDERIKNTYKDNSKTGAINALYDSYVRSLRWATDRIGESGIIAFITNASFIKSDSGSGIRASLQKEFTDIWCFDLRGNQRTKGEISKKEGGKIFGSGSRAPVAITILVKNPNKKKCRIHYIDIGDYLSREQKLEIVKNFKSIHGIKNWKTIIPNKYHDWIEQRNREFEKYTPIGNKETKSNKDDNALFKIYSRGIVTSRDMWAYNSSEQELSNNMKRHIDYCAKQDLDNLIFDPTQAKWTAELIKKLRKIKPKFDKECIRIAMYRPFFKQKLYFDNVFNSAQYLIPKLFPKSYSKNLVICVPYKFMGKFSVIVTNITPDVQLNYNGQCFPLYVYEHKDDKKLNITDTTLTEYQQHYDDKKITKKSIFYYVYGLLHHTGYKEKFANNLSKEFPHISMTPDFWKFSNAGEKLVDLHLNYETCKKYKLDQKIGFGKLEKMAFPKIKINNKRTPDKTKLKINGNLVFENIPHVSYQVNGRTPLEWLIDRYKKTTDNDSLITNDPTMHMTEEKTTSMIERIIYVSVESDKIINEISKLPFEPKNWAPQKTGLDKYSNA